MKRIRNLTLFFILTMSIGLSIAFGRLCWQQAHQFVNIQRPAVMGAPIDYGLSDAQVFEVVTSDNVNIPGWFVPPTREDGATILFLHGHGGSRLELLPEAHLFLSMGYGLALFDMRGGGDDGLPVTMGVNEVLDVEAVFDYLLTQDTVNPERIAVFGSSMGAATAILSAAQMPEIRVVIADAPYSSIRDTLVDGIPQRIGIPPLFFPDVIIAMSSYLSGADYRLASPIEALAEIDQPLLLIHGTLDGTIPYHHSEELYAAANEPKLLYLVDGGGHANSYTHDAQGFEAIVLPFVAQYLTD